MAVSKVCIILVFIASIWAVDGASHHMAPSPAVDCTNLVLNMAECLSYVQNGSTVTKPEGSCCSGLKTVLKTDAECLCEAFKNSASLGVVLNVTKAMTLPAACKISAPSATNCALTVPAGAPGMAPTSIAGAPTMTMGANEQAPAPAPGISGSSVLTISLGSLLIGLVVTSFSSF